MFSYEKYAVHPAVCAWLVNNGYIYEHESTMPYSGRADFFACHPDGQDLIVECKSGVRSIKKMISQAKGYQQQFVKGTDCAIAMPADEISPEIRDAIESYGLLLIAVDIPSRMQFEEALAKFATPASKPKETP